MIVATVVDATDGWLARRARVSNVLPLFSGARLDNIVDYLTYVFAPAIVMERAGVMAGVSGHAAIVAMLLASAYGFSREDAKSSDNFFTGFPSYWNIVAFYLYMGGLSADTNAGIVLLLAALVFVPIGYVYPSRTPTLRTWTLLLGSAWGVLLIWLVLELPASPRQWLAVSLAYPLYYFILSLILHSRRPQRN
jgi:phosphatidylcholine synthase